jgi:hypothetical protein
MGRTLGRKLRCSDSGVSHNARRNEEQISEYILMLRFCVKFNFKSLMCLLNGPGANDLVLNSFLAS